MKNAYVFIFAPILAVLLLATVGFVGIFASALQAGPASAPVVAGAAQVLDSYTPAEAVANTIAAPGLPAGEEAQVQPQGQPENVPTSATAAAQ